MCKQHADIYLRCCSGSSQLPVDSTNECYDCIGSGHADGYGIVCLELWSKWHLECSFTELFWIEYNTHTDGVQHTGYTGRYQRHSNERMSGCSVDLQHSRCTGSYELLVDLTGKHDDFIGSGNDIDIIDHWSGLYGRSSDCSRC